MRRFIMAPVSALALALSLALVQPAAAHTTTVPETLIQDLQADLDLQPFQAAAIAGNLAQETGNFTILKQIKGPGLGYSQWTGSRRTQFQRFAGAHTMAYETNYGFLVSELKGPYAEVLDKLRATRSTEDATRVFMNEFLKPSKKHAAFPKRVRFAQAYLQGNFDGAGCRSGSHLGNGRMTSC